MIITILGKCLLLNYISKIVYVLLRYKNINILTLGFHILQGMSYGLWTVFTFTKVIFGSNLCLRVFFPGKLVTLCGAEWTAPILTVLQCLVSSCTSALKIIIPPHTPGFCITCSGPSWLQTGPVFSCHICPDWPALRGSRPSGPA